MYQELRLHGHLNDTIEYYASVASSNLHQHYFYEQEGDTLRFFSPGNELVLNDNRLEHRGNGGTFCEYMFGVEQPLSDMAKAEVRNRLVLYGATYRDDHELVFTDQTDGSLGLDQVFLEGHAICNYFFFLTGPVAGRRSQQQRDIVRLLGKQLKRSPHVGTGDDSELVSELVRLIGPRSALYLIKLVHKPHKAYAELFSRLYFANKAIGDTDFDQLQALAQDLDIDRYQQERIRIDVMYRHPDNRRIVDEYKNILIDCNRRGRIRSADNARLTRLKTLSVRNKIPSALFFTLDEMLRDDRMQHEVDKEDYLTETRQILEGILLHEADIDAGITNEDMLRLLEAKKQASENRDHAFEQMLLETGKICDERIRDGADIALLENFSRIITYFDRYDSASAHINRLAFMESMRLTEEIIRSLLGNRNAFEELEEGLFDRLFFSDVIGNSYLGRYGRTKVTLLRKGLAAIADGRMTIRQLLDQEEEVAREERLWQTLFHEVKERFRNLYTRANTRAEQEELRRELGEVLNAQGLWQGEIPKRLFRDVLLTIRKEALYLHSLLPDILENEDVALREDFIANSGLDRFHIEELERSYCEQNSIPPERLERLRKNTARGAA